MGTPVFVTGAILDEQYDPNTNVFKWGDRFRDDSGREFILCKFNNGVGNEAAVIGHLICGMDITYDTFEGSNDADDAEVINQNPLGFMQAAPADGKGVWCQYKGYNKQALATLGVGKDVFFTASLATAGTVKTLSAVTEANIGVTREASVANVLAAGRAYLNIPI